MCEFRHQSLRLKCIEIGLLYKLSLRDQEKYRKYHKHIAPEVVRGTHPVSSR